MQPRTILAILATFSLLALIPTPATAHAGVCTGSDPDDDSSCLAVEEDMVHAVVCLQPQPNVCTLYLGAQDVAQAVGSGCYADANVQTGKVTFWEESNGLTHGGAPTAQDYAASAPNPPDAGSSGLQTAATTLADGTVIPADTLLEASAVATTCGGLA